MSVAMAATMAAASLPAAAMARPTVPRPALVATHHAEVFENASVLGLEGEDTKAAETLTAALRKAFAERGYSGGEEISLAELRLSMGCESNEESCLAEGGDALGVSHLIYGSLKGGGPDYELKVTILNVSEGMVERETTVPVSKKDLAPDRIDAKATDIVNTLLPGEESDTLPPTTAAAASFRWARPTSAACSRGWSSMSMARAYR
jgi:hypothetical protein